MPKFKVVEFIASNAAGASDKFSVSVEIDANGSFYCYVPKKLTVAFHDDNIRLHQRSGQREGFFFSAASTFQELVTRIKKAHNDFMSPTIKEEPVILYNIESHVSFSLTKDGTIAPNAGFPDSVWADCKDKTYGGHHASDPSEGGYSLTIGAKAMTKKTITYGEKSSVEYSYYYKGGSHLGHENPAQLLNSWASINLPEDAKEIPYSDGAAIFFFNLLMSMAELNRRVQEFTNTPKKLSLAIRRHSGALLLSGPDKSRKEEPKP